MSQTATKTLDAPTLSPVIPALIAQISLTIALLLLIRDLWMLVPLDHALMTAGGSGAVLYAALMGGYVVTKRAMIHVAPEETEPAAGAPEDAGAPTLESRSGEPVPGREPTTPATAGSPAALPAPLIPA